MPSCFSHVQLFVTIWMVTHQSPLSMGFSRQEYWSGLLCLPPGDLSKPEIEPASLASPALAGRFFTTSSTCCSVAQLCSTLQPHGLQLAQTHVHWVGNAIQPSCPLLSHSPAFNLSQHPGFSIESVLQIRWPKYWNFSFSINPSNKYSGLISFMIDWSDVIAVQLILKNLLQHQSWKASILQHSAIFIVHFHIHTWLLEKPYFWLDGPLLAKLCLYFFTCCLGWS